MIGILVYMAVSNQNICKIKDISSLTDLTVMIFRKIV